MRKNQIKKVPEATLFLSVLIIVIFDLNGLFMQKYELFSFFDFLFVVSIMSVFENKTFPKLSQIKK